MADQQKLDALIDQALEKKLLLLSKSKRCPNKGCERQRKVLRLALVMS